MVSLRVSLTVSTVTQGTGLWACLWRRANCVEKTPPPRRRLMRWGPRLNESEHHSLVPNYKWYVTSCLKACLRGFLAMMECTLKLRAELLLLQCFQPAARHVTESPNISPFRYHLLHVLIPSFSKPCFLLYHDFPQHLLPCKYMYLNLTTHDPHTRDSMRYLFSEPRTVYLM